MEYGTLGFAFGESFLINCKTCDVVITPTTLTIALLQIARTNSFQLLMAGFSAGADALRGGIDVGAGCFYTLLHHGS